MPHRRSIRDNHEIVTKKIEINISPHLDLSRGPRDPRANVLPMSLADPWLSLHYHLHFHWCSDQNQVCFLFGGQNHSFKSPISCIDMHELTPNQLDVCGSAQWLVKICFLSTKRDFWPHLYCFLRSFFDENSFETVEMGQVKNYYENFQIKETYFLFCFECTFLKLKIIIIQ